MPGGKDDEPSELDEGLVVEGADGEPKGPPPTPFWEDARKVWAVLAAIALQTFGFDIINSKLPILLTTEFARTAYSELLPHPELKNADGEFDLSFQTDSMLNLQRRSACTVGDWFHPDPAMNLLNPSVEELPSAPECVPPNDPLGRDQFPDENANGIVCCQPAADMKDWPAGQDEGAVWRGYLVYDDSCPVGVADFELAQNMTGSPWHYPNYRACSEGNKYANLVVTRGQSLNQFLIFLCSTFFAHLSDMVGRRPCLIVAFAGNFFPSIAFLLWAVGHGSIYAYYIIKGVTYGMLSSGSICYAIIGDVTHKNNRARCFGLIMVVWRLGDMVAPLGAILAISTDAWLSLAMMAAALVIVVVYIPESLPPEDKIEFTWTVFKNPFKPQMKILQSRIWVYFLYAFAFHSGPDAAIWISASFYFQAFFNLDSVGIGWYGVFLSASSLVTQFGILPWTVKHFSNLGTTRIAIYTQMVFVIIIAVGGLPGFEWLAYPATAYFLGWWRGYGTLYFPSINAAVTNCADKAEQATVMGAVHGIQNLANSICLVFFGWAYDYNPSLPFGGAVVFYWVVIYYTYKLQWIVTPNGSKRSEGDWEHAWSAMADKTERRIRALEEEVVELRQRVAALDGLGPQEPGTEPPGAANGHGSITAL